ncbi:uncharacterized protein BDR25DRAFT_370687 [Lindgomyces ingoldianus]|uniref:Uncharacterized protein n=1 Tax=Lindgomyces ingoldianus TaxID=673940 RepID=A0ACB6RC29_9PLEO|nr:uncharacterized protein BDR25DRAFT_370687 [Lindgomyces ingoldianus]KAF2476884.1 hypothetical protein BDR25DRAFT_370687 [Lindgomyces ingoldianus]
MENPSPSLQLADTDGTGPVKRRRPALSCVECRRRKVRCDREKPCGPCTRAKSPTCTYRPNPHTIDRRPRAAAPTSAHTNQDSSNRSSLPSSIQAIDFESMVNRYIAPGIFGPHGSVTLSHLPSPNVDPGASCYTSAIKSLVDNVFDLDGSSANKDEESSKVLNIPIRNAVPTTPGQFVKSKFYGETHWLNSIEPVSVFENPPLRTEINRASELYQTVLECKRMARTIKSARVTKHSISPEIQSSIPARDVCDQLVQCYLRTFEGVFRVLHIPTFLAEYDSFWGSAVTGKPTVLIKILLVCAIGAPFYKGLESASLRSSCAKWMQTAETFLSAPQGKSRLNLTGLQIHILLLLAREICNVDGGDLTWIPAGSLLRSAMHIGLHRDPSHFPKISVFHAEMRRRLWATVLEITVQSSLDMGMPPMLSLNDFDTLPPSNINDEDMGEGIEALIDLKPPQVFTQTSTQIALNKSLPLRLKITRLINSLRSDLSYDESLRLGSELIASCRANTQLFQGFFASTASPTTFQVKLLDVLTRRFVLCLHRPFFIKAKADPKFYYSRKICLDTSLCLLAPTSIAPQPSLEHTEMTQEDDWARLTTHCVGFFKSIFLYSTTTVYLELLSQIEEQQEDRVPFPTFLVYPAMSSTKIAALAPRANTGAASTPDSTTPLSKNRIKNGETNAKGYVFLACALARIDAIVSGTDPDKAVLSAAKKSAAACADWMRKTYQDENNVEMNVGALPQMPAEKNGSVGTETGDFGGLGVMEDMDWDTLMHDDTMDFGFGFEENESWWLGGLGGTEL